VLKHWPEEGIRHLAEGALRLAWRAGVFVVGSLLLVAGIIMIVTPGPAVIFIPLGLGVLATEFQWARNLLSRARPIIDRALDRAKRRRGKNDQPAASTHS
jgi:uncharacterized protein (TIGR02611 family)